jgi:hypothetical protein
VTEVGRGGKWLLTANDPEVKTLEPGAEDVGLAVYDLREKTGWRGRKRFRLYLTVQGRGRFIEVAGVGLFRRKPIPPDRPVRWTRMNDAATPYSPLTGAIPLTLTDSGVDQWGGLITHLPLDVSPGPSANHSFNGVSPLRVHVCAYMN